MNYKEIPPNVLEYDGKLQQAMMELDSSDIKFEYRFNVHNPLPRSKLLPITLVKDQGRSGSCTAFGAAGCLESLILKKFNILIHNHNVIDLSELFLYSITKEHDPWKGVMYSGSSTMTAARMLLDYGCCLEKLLKYKEITYIKPNQIQLNDALFRKCLAIHYLEINKEDIKQALAQDMPVLIAIHMFEGFKNKNIKSGKVDMIGYVKRSGHAIMIYGYDEGEEVFYVKNSWGKDWGNQGTVKIPYDILITVLKTCIAIEGVKASALKLKPKIEPEEPYDPSPVTPPLKKYKSPWYKRFYKWLNN